MKDIKKELREKLKVLPDISYTAAADYEKNKEAIIAEVNEIMSSQEDVNQLTGNNPNYLMEENHQNHAEFMTNLFKMNNLELLSTVVPWVYRTYHNQGFNFKYFPRAFKAWKEAVKKYLEPENTYPILEVYQWFEESHEKMIELSKLEENPPVEISPNWKKTNEDFYLALMEGDHKKCMDIGDKAVNSPEDLQNFYLQVVQSCMYNIGFRWERGEVSAAHEHLATAIVSRVMANLYPKFILIEHTKERAVITASPNEYHELGARMIADLLEVEGWDIDYLGANVPGEELIELLLEEPPFLLGISVSMPFNIDKTSELIQKIKANEKLKDVKVMVGGKVFAEYTELWKVTGADGFATNGKEAIALAAKWWEDWR